MGFINEDLILFKSKREDIIFFDFSMVKNLFNDLILNTFLFRVQKSLKFSLIYDFKIKIVVCFYIIYFLLLLVLKKPEVVVVAN